MPRPRNTDQRKQQIVIGLLRAMARHGYDGASTTEIARAAGLSPGLVHYHFGDKRKILLALLEHLAAAARARAAARVAAAGDGALQRLDAYLGAHLSLEAADDAAEVPCWIAIAAEAVRQPAVRKAYAAATLAAIAELEKLCSAALRAAGRPPREAPAMAAALFAAVQGALVLAGAAPGAIPRGTASASAQRMARGFLRDAP